MNKLFKTVLFWLLSLAFLPAWSQEKKVVSDSCKVYIEVDEKANFPGGITGLRQFITSNLDYPRKAAMQQMEGIVVLSFTINETGKISDIQVEESKGELLDNESIRMVKAMPNWIPAKQNGKPVKVRYTLPVKFQLY